MAILISADGIEKGTYTEGEHKTCPMEGCKGSLLTVTWSDGEVTKPCTEGCYTNDDGNLQIYKDDQ